MPPVLHASSLSQWSASRGRWKSLPRALRVYLATIMLVTFSTGLALIYYSLTGHAYQAQLWTTQADNFGDFWHYKKLFDLFHTAAFFQSADRFAYPAPCAIVLAMLYHTGPRPHLVFDLILASIYAVSGVLFYRMLRRFELENRVSIEVTLLLMMTSYPWHTLYDRGNIELFVYVFLGGGVWAYLTGRKTLAAALWGLAGAMKIYPLALLGMFAHKKVLRPLLAGLGTFGAALLASFWYVGPTIEIAAMGSLNGMFGFLGQYASVARSHELNLDHSILGATKEILSLPILHLGHAWPRLSKIYQAIVLVGGTAAWFVWVRKLPTLNQLCLFLMAIVLLPPVSYDYTLIHTYLVMGIVLGAYCYALRQDVEFPGADVFFVAFGVVATAQTWIQIHEGQFNGVIKCLALLTICYLLLRYPLRMGLDVERIES